MVGLHHVNANQLHLQIPNLSVHLSYATERRRWLYDSRVYPYADYWLFGDKIDDEMNTSTEGWVLISPETDEFYGQAQYRNADGEMTDNIKAVERSWDNKGYCFCTAGLGKLEIVK